MMSPSTVIRPGAFARDDATGKREVEVAVAERVGDAAEALADELAMDGIGTLAELRGSAQFEGRDSYGAQLARAHRQVH